MIVAAPRRRIVSAVALLLIVVVGLAAPVSAAPSGVENEGGTPTLRDQLDSIGRDYNDAVARLEHSKKLQKTQTAQLGRIEQRWRELHSEATAIAAQIYRTGRISAASALLGSASPDQFFERAMMLDQLATRDNAQLRALADVRAEYARQKALLDEQVRVQEAQAAKMAKAKSAAEKALALVGGAATGGFVSAESPVAKPAPRNPDGSWPKEYCSVDDPTTNGCITPRAYHALAQAKAAGFGRYVSCFREFNDGGEHPKGRACDFSAQANGFGGHATGGARLYGNNLAAFFVRNAARLGVLYVIWYRQIWFPGQGWSAYHGGSDPASAHTNHVHLSVQ